MSEHLEEIPMTQDRRRFQRYPASDRALVAEAGGESGLPFHLIDISEGGMAFRYFNTSRLPLDGSHLDIYMETELCVSRLPVKVVSDRPLTGDYFPKRRCGVRFGTLTSAQQIELEQFISRQSRRAM